MKTTSPILAAAALALATLPAGTADAASGNQIWVGAWDCKSQSSSGVVRKIVAAANGDYSVSEGNARFDGYWSADDDKAYYFLIPFVMEGWVTVTPTANGFTADSGSESHDCTPSG